MKKVKRNVYLCEFEKMSYRQRFYYLWNNELSVRFPDFNINPLKWCLLDVLKLCYVPVLYLFFVPTLAAICACEARRLKFRHVDSEDKNCTYVSNAKILEANK